jgi:hypothetical protein
MVKGKLFGVSALAQLELILQGCSGVCSIFAGSEGPLVITQPWVVTDFDV